MLFVPRVRNGFTWFEWVLWFGKQIPQCVIEKKMATLLVPEYCCLIVLFIDISLVHYSYFEMIVILAF